MNDRTLWYFAHPYQGNPKENYELCAKRTALLISEGYLVVSPVLQTHEPAQCMHVSDWSHSRWLEYTHNLLVKCDGIIFAPGSIHSDGCMCEKEAADEIGMPIREYHEILDGAR